MISKGSWAIATSIAKRYKTPETTLKDKVIACLLQLPGVDAIRHNTGKIPRGSRWIAFGYPGMADIYCRVRGARGQRWATLWIELKAEGKQEPAQIAFQEKVLAWGDTYELVRSVDDCIEAVERARATLKGGR